MSNVQTVQQIYTDFGTGNVAGILDVISPDAEWINDGPSEIPYAKHRRGVAQISEFFNDVYANIEVARFEPKEFVAEGEQVIVFGRWGGKAKSTGRSFESDWAMRWCFKDGKVSYLRSYEDTTSTAAAFRG